MKKSRFALLVYSAYLDWDAEYGDKEAFTYAMGVAYGLFCAGSKELSYDQLMSLAR